MAPLDTGNVMNLRLVDPLGEHVGPSSADFDQLGAFLRAMRTHRGLTIDDLAETTKISRGYLRAIEENEFSALPSRPFSTGYVRAYAEALGADGEAAVARFRQEAPDLSEPLRNPIGVHHEDSRRNPLILAAVGLVVVGVISWNVVQRATGADAPPPSPFVSLSGAQAAEPKLPKGPIALGAATAPPADQTMPTPYVTPGLEAVIAPGAKPGQPPTPTPSVYATPSTFTPRGQVYGGASGVVLQASKAVSLIVRGAGGAVYFARQLQPGEAYRAPVGEGLSVDISDPAAVNLYMGGQLQGAMAANLVTIDKLVAKTPAPVVPAPVATAAISKPAPPHMAATAPTPQPAKPADPAA